MKPSNLIIITIFSLMFLYIQVWEHRVVIPIYLTLLGLCIIYSLYIKNINMLHISAFIFILTAISPIIFESGLINYLTPIDNPSLQSILIYGTQFSLSTLIVLTLIFRVQISRLLSKSKTIELTHYDGVFHWIYIYNSLLYLAVLIEDMAYIYLEMKTWTLIYDNFEGLVYIAWALNCGVLLTMMITSEKPDKTVEERAL